ncbi:dienelactone hydrolase family protein [Rhodococcus sp. (in: high G+C Gram-positive bacteria)]|uniref:dienelactone hydrolase family protein n=1 Tax=Rhodococcus sp. TaxID=1831 RepID=UPI001A063F29|nr:dienelactone hydrolase family protein [Rhodococcus sp. (in: high G+C Gram-positive bacteria)]MBF0663738.1 dienelactone hydrolase family protein [Rhodococcus sp. (in: high G+C Gram-positive bacteria)]
MPETSNDAAPRIGGTGDVPLTVVRPDSGPRGSIVVLHRSHGLPRALRDFIETLADDRWLVVAPEPTQDARGAENAEQFGDEFYANVDATFRWIAGQGISPDMIGVLGFDDAGTAALYVAAERVVGAVVSVASPGIVQTAQGGTRSLVDIVGSLRAPWLGLYGDDDPKTPPSEVAALREAAGRSDAPALVVSYEGLAHRPDEPPVVHDSLDPETDRAEAAIVDARRRIYDWFDTHLR